jgi:hypothetical protein
MAYDIRSGRMYWVRRRGREERVFAISYARTLDRWLCECTDGQEAIIEAAAFIRLADELL